MDGLPVEECVSIGFYTEEKTDLKERQEAIDAAYGQRCASTGKMHLFPRVDEGTSLSFSTKRGSRSLRVFTGKSAKPLWTLRPALSSFGRVRRFVRRR